MTFRGLLRMALLLALIPLVLKSRARLVPVEAEEDVDALADPGADFEDIDDALVDINSASRELLETLPGIGAAHADEIVRHRPYRGKRDLLRRGIVSASVYTEIRNQVIARHHSDEEARADA